MCFEMILRGRKRKAQEKLALDFSAVQENRMTEVSSIVQSGVSYYVKDIYNVYKLTEENSVVDDYMSRQPEINEEGRAVLVDWLIKIHTQLAQETLYLTINILDRFLAKETVKMNEIKLVGMAAMVVSCKYDEEQYPNAESFRKASRIENSSMENTFSQAQINAMEEKILLELNWKLTVPTPYVFIVRCLRSCSDGDSKMKSLIFYLSELSMAHYATIKYSPSMLAASAVYVARRMLKPRCQWSRALEVHSGYKKGQLKDCAELIAQLQGEMANENTAKERKLKELHNKYSVCARDEVALLPPANA